MILVELEDAEKILNNDRSMSIDLTEHDAKVRADVIDEANKKLDDWWDRIKEYNITDKNCYASFKVLLDDMKSN